MNENIHNDDNSFRDMYGNFEEEPSPEVWDKLNAKLDKRDALFYRTRSLVWKRSAFALLLLLLLFAGYEYGFKTKQKPGEEVAKTNLPGKPINGSGKENLNPVNPLDTPLSSFETRENSNKTSSKIPADTSYLYASQSSAKRNLHRSKKISSNDSLAVSLILKNNTRATERATTVFVKDHKDNGLLLEKKIYSRLNGNTNIQSKKNADEAVVGSGLNYHYKQNAQHEMLNTDTLLSNRKEKNSENESSFDRNNLTLLSQDKQAISDEKESTNPLKNNADSIASASSTVAKKSVVRLNRMFKPHWSFSPYFAADFSGHLLDDDERFREPNGRDNSHELAEREKEQFGYSLGALARYQFSKKWLIKTSLVFANQSIQISPQTLYALSNSRDTKFKYVTSSGYAYINPSFSQSINVGDSIISQIAEERFSYLTVPVQISYMVHAGKRLSVLPGIGITTNVLLQSKISTEVHDDNGNEYSDVVIRHLQGVNHINFSMIADAEMQYKVANKWSIMLLPSFKYALNPITKQHVVKTYPYNFGLGFGVTYNL